MIKLSIDGRKAEFDEELTIIQACKKIGIEIPHFCYHEKLKIAGNCRMCLVDVDKNPKLQASCATNIKDGMVVNTKSAKVQKAREGVMEFLLINHPLDCPICDQGGECDLQDQAFKYGNGKTRLKYSKRSVEKKYMGPLIETNMTRCIHCTRCIRFASDIAGVGEIGTKGRGEDMEVLSYVNSAIESEISGNMIDLCPVGALTSKPYAFTARNWEMTHTQSIDIHDALCSNIRIDSYGVELKRILPIARQEINQEWISDKARFSYDGLNCQRLDRPYIRKNGKLSESSWNEALNLVAKKIKQVGPDSIGAISGDLTSVEAMFALKTFFKRIHCPNFDSNSNCFRIDNSSRGNYLFNTTIEKIDEADLFLFVGANPKHSAPLINVRIGSRVRAGDAEVFSIGDLEDQNYKIENLGNKVKIIQDILQGKHQICKKFKKAKKPVLIIGDGVFKRTDGLAITSMLQKIANDYNFIHKNWNGFNILHNHVGMIGGFDVGFIPQQGGRGVASMLKGASHGEIKLLYLLGADNIDFQQASNAFIIYQGHHGDKGAENADIVLPSAAYTEQDATYVNLEGRVQFARAAIPPPGQALEDWNIINDIAEKLNLFIANSLEDLRNMMAQENKIFAPHNVDKLTDNKMKEIISNDKLLPDHISGVSKNYYMTDIISSNSKTMAACAAIASAKNK